METILTILPVLTIPALGVASLVWILFRRKGNNTTGRSFANPLVGGPRYRDGAVTYNQFDGGRYNIELEDPRGRHSARYRRRHPPRQRKQKKPWMRERDTLPGLSRNPPSHRD